MDLAQALLDILDGLPAVTELGTVRPVILVAETGGPARSSAAPPHLVEGDFQLDVYAETKPAANDLAWDAHNRILAAPRDQPSTVTVNHTRVTPPTWVPDDDWPVDGRPGPRYLLTGNLKGHV